VNNRTLRPATASDVMSHIEVPNDSVDRTLKNHQPVIPEYLLFVGISFPLTNIGSLRPCVIQIKVEKSKTKHYNSELATLFNFSFT
jgi:hypothetical protein